MKGNNMKELIEDKNWSEYTKDEQKELLEHWWVYYGKMLYTGEELEIFNDSYDKGLYAKYTTEKENKIIKAFSYTDTWSEVKELNKDLPFK